MNTKRLMELLNHRQLPHEALSEVSSSGETGLQATLAVIKQGGTTDLRLINALVLVVKARYLGDPAEVFNVLLDTASHKSIRVRSAAVGLALNLIHRERLIQPSPREIPQEADAVEDLRYALALGLDPVTSDRVSSFLTEFGEG